MLREKLSLGLGVLNSLLACNNLPLGVISEDVEDLTIAQASKRILRFPYVQSFKMADCDRSRVWRRRLKQKVLRFPSVNGISRRLKRTRRFLLTSEGSDGEMKMVSWRNPGLVIMKMSDEC
jgi:hypothetical protein